MEENVVNEDIADDAVAAAEQANMEILLDVPLAVHVQVGQTRMPLREVLKLGPGSILRLNKNEGDGVELYINGRLIANGQIIQTPEGNIGVEVTSIVTRAERLRSVT
jgi:flagellar motor switch protein FliN/FliY